MKTRLLKKIRKRYTITKIDRIASNACDLYKKIESDFGMPFFVLEDSRDTLGFRTYFFTTFNAARERLCKWIANDYGEKFRHKDEKSSKVWWVKN